MKLNKFIRILKPIIGSDALLVTNIDDVFRELINLGVTEIEVDRLEMNLIVSMFLASCGDKEPLKGKIIRENILDKFMGIKLILID